VRDAVPPPPDADGAAARLREIFARQQQAFRDDPYPSLEARLAHLDKLASALRAHEDALVQAVSDDFGHRCAFETQGAELMVALQKISYVRGRLKRWMRRSKRRPGLLFASTSAWVEYQPLGVVGVLSPWNYPVQLAVVPLVFALAAGNRVMLKPSEMTPRTSAVLAGLLGECFDVERVAVIEGDAAVAQAFTALPLDHLFFTGSTRVGREVMRAAADTLTPVTLELGGKSPAIVSATADLAEAAERICFGKVMNAGQTCVAPDYVLCPRESVEALVAELRGSFRRMFPRVAGNPDYTAIISDRHLLRLRGLLEEAAAAGARVLPLADEDPAAAERERRMILHVVIDPPADVALMREEIFGPILPIVPVDGFDEAVAHVKARPHPLALNYFGRSREQQHRVVRELHAGTVCLNDAIFQVAVEDLPFGGVGESGMGNYHGEEGFYTFSHAKGVFSRPRFNTARVFHPPYGSTLQRLILKLFMR
jgi:coniferyl-aldehyde dehydrogenase